MTADIRLVRSNEGDWIGLYRDGKLLGEGHSFGASELLSLLGIEHETIFLDLDDRLPDTWPPGDWRGGSDDR